MANTPTDIHVGVVPHFEVSRIYTTAVEAAQRASTCIDVVRPLIESEDVDARDLIAVIEQMIADTYEVAWGRGYDSANRDAETDGPLLPSTLIGPTSVPTR